MDTWLSVNAERFEVAPADVREAEVVLKSLDTTLRTPDALHIAIARRTGLDLFTFDAAMSRHAAALGIRIVA